jgi:hypothetical protein
MRQNRVQLIDTDIFGRSHVVAVVFGGARFSAAFSRHLDRLVGRAIFLVSAQLTHFTGVDPIVD